MAHTPMKHGVLSTYSRLVRPFWHGEGDARHVEKPRCRLQLIPLCTTLIRYSVILTKRSPATRKLFDADKFTCMWNIVFAASTPLETIDFILSKQGMTLVAVPC